MPRAKSDVPKGDTDGRAPAIGHALPTPQQQDLDRAAHDVFTAIAERDEPRLAAMIDRFAHLLRAPALADLRFDPTTLDMLVHRYLPFVLDSEPEDLCEELYGLTIDTLATDEFLTSMLGRLERLIATPLCQADRVAICAALITTRALQEHRAFWAAELPALYALFRIQLSDWLIDNGKRQSRLVSLAERLREGDLSESQVQAEVSALRAGSP